MRRFFISLFATASVIGFLIIVSPFADADDVAKKNKSLEKIHTEIISDYPELDHIDQTAFQSVTQQGEDVLVFDVREPGEYDVSRLEGAIRLDPDMSAEDFAAQYGDRIAGRSLIFYCSVGRRSSILANKVREQSLASGARQVANLEGGIFRWHNDQMSLINEVGPTDEVHPYNRYWGRLIARKDKIKNTPRNP